MTTKNYEYLRYNGPAPMDELPNGGGLSIRDKQAGIWKFYGSWSTSRSSRPGGPTVPVFYIRGLHTERQVVWAWFNANPRAVENLPRKSLINVLNRNGSEFAEAIRKVSRMNGK